LLPPEGCCQRQHFFEFLRSLILIFSLAFFYVRAKNKRRLDFLWHNDPKVRSINAQKRVEDPPIKEFYSNGSRDALTVSMMNNQIFAQHLLFSLTAQVKTKLLALVVCRVSNDKQHLADSLLRAA
jgi:hypothetical protein